MRFSFNKQNLFGTFAINCDSNHIRPEYSRSHFVNRLKSFKRPPRKQEEEGAKDTVQTKPCWPTHLIVTKIEPYGTTEKTLQKRKMLFSPTFSILLFWLSLQELALCACITLPYSRLLLSCTHIYYHILSFPYYWLVFSRTKYDFLYLVMLSKQRLCLICTAKVIVK